VEHGRCCGPAGNLIVPASGLYWLGWTLPASGYTLETAPVLNDPLAWTTPATSTIIPLTGGKTKQLITTNDVSGDARTSGW